MTLHRALELCVLADCWKEQHVTLALMDDSSRNENAPHTASAHGGPVVDEILAWSQKAPLFHRHVVHHLDHPRCIEMGCHPSHLDSPTAKVHEKQDGVRHQPPSVQTSAVKKSVATSTSICVWMNSFQVVVVLRAGAGAMPWRLRILSTV
jgi:hypothetical protein